MMMGELYQKGAFDAPNWGILITCNQDGK